MALTSPPVQPGRTRMCVLPFLTPGLEPDGGVRLCSAASIYDYPDETRMGDIRPAGLAAVWRNERYRTLRSALLSGNGLPPYCQRCDYRFEGPPWLLTFHLALQAHYRGRQRDPAITNVIRRYRARYPEYRAIGLQHGLPTEPFPANLAGEGGEDHDFLAAGGERHAIEFAGLDQWRDVAVPISRRLARRLAKALAQGAGLALAIRWRNLVEGRTGLAAPNVRVSLEHADATRLACAFQPVEEALTVDSSFPLAAMTTTVRPFAWRGVVRLRIGGFGAAGTAIVIEDLMLVRTAGSGDASLAAGVAALVSGTALPLEIDLNTLNRCNVSCVMCTHAIRYDDRGDDKPPLYRLSLPEYQRIVAGVAVASAHFVGAYAEPLMNKDLFAMLAHARAQGTVTAVTTNATLLSRAFAEKLVDAGLGLLTVSLHGASKAVAEKIMRGADFDRVIANIETLQQVKDRRGSDRPLVQINCVGQRDNVHELPALIGLAARLGIRIIQFVHLLVSADIDPKNSLVHHPQALTDSVRRAQTLAAQLGVTLHISPTYIAVIEEFERTGAAAVHAPPPAGCA